MIIFFSSVSRGVRPFGVSLLVAGWDRDLQRPFLYQCDPSVSLLCEYKLYKPPRKIYLLPIK